VRPAPREAGPDLGLSPEGQRLSGPEGA
jgi:hypothetical protein